MLPGCFLGLNNCNDGDYLKEHGCSRGSQTTEGGCARGNSILLDLGRLLRLGGGVVCGWEKMPRETYLEKGKQLIKTAASDFAGSILQMVGVGAALYRAS